MTDQMITEIDSVTPGKTYNVNVEAVVNTTNGTRRSEADSERITAGRYRMVYTDAVQVVVLIYILGHRL